MLRAVRDERDPYRLAVLASGSRDGWSASPVAASPERLPEAWPGARPYPGVGEPRAVRRAAQPDWAWQADAADFLPLPVAPMLEVGHPEFRAARPAGEREYLERWRRRLTPDWGAAHCESPRGGWPSLEPP